MMTPEFLGLAEVLEIHANQIHLYGGSPGVRDMPTIDSAHSLSSSAHDQNESPNHVLL
jgi:prophage maintenance system killer protein